MMAMKATLYSGWIYDHLVPHADRVKVAHPLMLRAIATAKLTKRMSKLRCPALPLCGRQSSYALLCSASAASCSDLKPMRDLRAR